MTALARYLVELTPPESGYEDIQALGARSRAACQELSRGGTPVRFLRAVFVPEDESCFLLFEADSRAAVQRAAAEAGVDLRQFAEILSTSHPREATS